MAKLRALALGLTLAVSTSAAHAFRIELKDVAPDRIERQRAEAIGMLPLPGTPNVGQLEQRLSEKGVAAGSPMFIRVFKAESELEIWLQKGDRFELFATYPICHWSGTLGPKISEGDKQSPEGVYTVGARQLHMIGRHPRSLNLGFPNTFDRQYQRTGSYILIHGGCGSVGCFAMTNPVIEEIFSLAQQSIKSGQENIHVHVFPFRLTEAKLQNYALHEWYDFWRNLKDVYDSFEKSRQLPKVSVCEGRYWVETNAPSEAAAQSPLAACGTSLAAVSQNSETEVATEIPSVWTAKPVPPLWQAPTDQQALSPQSRRASPARAAQVQPLLPVLPSPSGRSSASRPSAPAPKVAANNPHASRSSNAARQPGLQLTTFGTSKPSGAPCTTTLASCRKWVALHRAMDARAMAEKSRPVRVARRFAQQR